ncbi:MAG: Na+/H+ antiporter NhaC family protein [Frisingicoccus sp.]|uniref:YfcC family protein n=1 Tax=Frisingicoccus sp. TaxID=1918627 RepID=UPI00261C1CAE|nr:Na+/H+ antiporter NhaC family protein [Frisingicoccus sp.]MDD6231320.1 Na+/H+ antiporter NhaC family protein [Frisingicoccus sp.]
MEKKKRKFKVPHTYVIIACIIILVTICTYIVPAGIYDRVDLNGRSVIDPDTYHSVEQSPVGIFELLNCIPEGYSNAASIIFLVFFCGGCFNVITESGAITRGIGKLAKASRGKERLLIPGLMLVFVVAGATCGMNEEGIIFIPIGIALARAIGFDAIVGMSIVALGAGVGYSSGCMNAFNVGIAQGIAELPIFSGLGLRVCLAFVIWFITAIYVTRYAKKVKANPTLSYVADLEEAEKDQVIDLNALEPMTKRDVMVLIVVAVSIGIYVYGVFSRGWYLNEMVAVFVAMAIIGGLIAGFGPSTIAKSFVEGAKGMVFGALVIGLARTILVVMTHGAIIDVFIHSMAGVVAVLPKGVAAVGMLVVQACTNLFIPSASGQAAVTMPLMVPLADVIGITRQTAVLAFNCGDGFTNQIIPTSTVLMANLSVAKIPYQKWVRFVAPLMGIWLLTCAVFIVIATYINYGPF